MLNIDKGVSYLTCRDEMAALAFKWHSHVFCLGYRVSYSSWMAGKYFPRFGTLPAYAVPPG